MLTRDRMRPEPLYLGLNGFYTLFFNVVIAVNQVYLVQAVGLGPLQLTLVGTALEATNFVFEVPTGVVADVVSRRLSVVIGIALVGLGFVFSGSIARFETVMAAQVVLGTGLTFISGAQQAWITDEVGPDRAGPIFLRTVQVEQVARLIGIPIGTGLGLLNLHLPLLAGGGALIALALVLFFVMPETGFRPKTEQQRIAWHDFAGTFSAGRRLVRGTPLLMTAFAITLLYGANGEAFDRLFTPHFFQNIGFPSLHGLQPVFWIGFVRMTSALLGLFLVGWVRRFIDTTSHASVTRALLIDHGLQVVSIFAFAFAGDFVTGMVLFWSVQQLSRIFTPLYLSWINQNVDSSVRATVMSMSSQVGGFGQFFGGPTFGAIGEFVSLRAALALAALVLSPAIPLYIRAFGQGRTRTNGDAGAGAEP